MHYLRVVSVGVCDLQFKGFVPLDNVTNLRREDAGVACQFLVNEIRYLVCSSPQLAHINQEREPELLLPTADIEHPKTHFNFPAGTRHNVANHQVLRAFTSPIAVIHLLCLRRERALAAEGSETKQAAAAQVSGHDFADLLFVSLFFTKRHYGDGNLTGTTPDHINGQLSMGRQRTDQ